MNLYDLTEEMKKIGYEPDDARARVCQDVVLKALSLSPLKTWRNDDEKYYSVKCGKEKQL